MVLRRLLEKVLKTASFAAAVMSAMRSAVEETRTARATIELVEQAGGVFTECGCFIQVRAQDLRFIMEQTSPQALNRLVDEVRRADDHVCAGKP